MSDVTQILGQIEDGDGQAAERLLPLVYDQLRQLAAAKMAQEDPGHTLQATALVHEAYIRLVDVDRAQHWHSRAHFFAAAAEAMRRILVENARRKLGPERGGDRRRIDLDETISVCEDRADELLAVHEALDKLSAESPRKADLVKLRYFTGMTLTEAAEALGISRATAARDWAYGKAHLLCTLQQEDFRGKTPK
jgi:RNA polymerase sigma factor (TIGR02999 family)